MPNTYEGVRYAHNDDEVATRKSYSYEPERDAQGTAIERVKTHASTEIAREDDTTMNCGIFIELLHVCNYISDVEEIKESRVYPAICSLGRDRCYHQFKKDGGDIFVDIARSISVGKRSISNFSKRTFATVKVPIFYGIDSVKFHVTKQTLQIAAENAKKSGLRTSQLNLYHTLTGIKYIVENEPDYIRDANEQMFKDVLSPLIKADRILEERREQLQAWMGV